MNKKITISIIISFYNQSYTACRAINNLANEAFKLQYNVKIIVVDDGSNEREQSIIKNKLLEFKNGNIETYYIWQEDKGFRLAKSRNNGIRNAQSEVLIFIDGDCIPINDFIYNHVCFHNANRNAICIGRRKYQLIGSDSHHKLINKQLEHKTNIEESTKIKKCDSLLPWTAVIGCNFSVRHSFPLPLFDENLIGWGFEDTDYGIKLFLDGYNVLYNNKAEVIHLQNEDDEFSTPMLYKNLLATILNGLILMSKYYSHKDIFVEISKYLTYYISSYRIKNETCAFDAKANEYYGKLLFYGWDRSFKDSIIVYNQYLEYVRDNKHLVENNYLFNLKKIPNIEK